MVTKEVSAKQPWATLAYASLLLLFGAVYVYAHHRAAFALPTPWSDEGRFVWPAISFQRSLSLLAPQLNPYRPIYWMPPGYMVALGIIFRIFGFSLGLARSVSMIFMIGTFIVTALMLRKYSLSFLSLLLLGLFFLNGPFVAAGNVARMEALLLLAVSVGVLLVQRGMPYRGLALLALTPLIHPNGLFFFLSAATYVILTNHLRKGSCPKSLTRADTLLIAVALMLWIAYAVHIGQDLPSFLNDMSYQFARKGQIDILQGFVSTEGLTFLSLSLLCLAYGTAKRVPATFLLVFAIPAWLVFKVGREMWYQVFHGLSYALLSITLLHVGHHLLDHVGTSRVTCTRWLLPPALAVGLLFWNVSNGRAISGIRYPTNLKWAGMRIPGEVSYLNSTDIRTVRLFLSTLPSQGRPARVQFMPAADALFFHDMDGREILIWEPLFLNERADVYVIHITRYAPSWYSESLKASLRGMGIDPSDESHIVLQRDGSEIWYFSFRQTVQH